MLDEATSNLDLVLEYEIEAALDVLLEAPHGDTHRPPADDGDEAPIASSWWTRGASWKAACTTSSWRWVAAMPRCTRPG